MLCIACDAQESSFFSQEGDNVVSILIIPNYVLREHSKNS